MRMHSRAATWLPSSERARLIIESADVVQFSCSIPETAVHPTYSPLQAVSEGIQRAPSPQIIELRRSTLYVPRHQAPERRVALCGEPDWGPSIHYRGGPHRRKRQFASLFPRPGFLQPRIIPYRPIARAAPQTDWHVLI